MILASCLCLSAKEVGWIEFGGGAEEGLKDELPVWNKHRAALVLDSPEKMRLRGVMLAGPDTMVEVLAKFGKEKESALVIDWLGEKPVDLARAMQFGGGSVRTTCRIGTTTITRTVICSREDDAVFIHLLANQPGALSFKVTLDAGADGRVKREDRRQLILTRPEELASHVWVLPFESDVTPEGDSIVVKGEGEALIVWNYASGRPISDTLTQLGKRYDPGHTPANPSKVWQGVLASHLKSIENSP
ncbi:MAG: glycoside hydrolase N-terminal domain-containing protein [Verrucomicrobiota bacterium]